MEVFTLLFLIAVFVLGAVTLFFVLRMRESASGGRFLERVAQMEARIERMVREEMATSRKEMEEGNRRTRQETIEFMGKFEGSVRREVSNLTEGQRRSFDIFSERLGDLIDRNEAKMNDVRKAVEHRLEAIQRDNGEKLEKMRETVDEKLHATLEKRLGESFKLVGVQLESVQKGLGEMQMLATGVGDLKKVLQNVKTRGTWGEVQLGTLLDDILTPDQYVKNVVTKKGSADRVEFAIRIPAKDEKIKTILLPIDAKFPLEDYQGLLEASERGDVEAIDRCSKALETRVKSEAKDIMTKYLDPPYTTDFGILFLPNEGLYAEVLRRPGFSDILRREYRVIITGPTTIAAILNSLQMGFRTLAITKRSSEVWEVLGAVKKEFSAFGDLLDKTHKKLQEASNTIDTASRKSRTIERKLGKVQELPEGDGGEVKVKSIEEGVLVKEI